MDLDTHTDHCECSPCLNRIIESIRRASRDKTSLELRVVQLETLVESLVKHIDVWAHTNHRAYHGPPAGYFNCTMPGCVESAMLVRTIENH